MAIYNTYDLIGLVYGVPAVMEMFHEQQEDVQRQYMWTAESLAIARTYCLQFFGLSKETEGFLSKQWRLDKEENKLPATDLEFVEDVKAYLEFVVIPELDINLAKLGRKTNYALHPNVFSDEPPTASDTQDARDLIAQEIRAKLVADAYEIENIDLAEFREYAQHRAFLSDRGML